jgi:prolyl-tRNA editing enzyme YbaK/EbsC (Cys-tRNA(Pro) deacylase)
MLADDRCAIEAGVRERLEALAVEHEILECDPDFADTAAFCARYGVPPEQSANTIVVAARKEPGVACACLVLATCRLDVNHAVCDLLGVRKASFASAEQTRDLTGMMIGGVTPFGLPDALCSHLYVDALVMTQPSVVIGGGSRSIKIRLAPSELLRIPGARAVDGLAFPPSIVTP